MAYVVNDLVHTDEEGNETAREPLSAHVRLAEGGTVKLYSGGTVPPEADLNHVAELVQRGVLSADESEPNPIKPNSVEAILAAVSDIHEAETYLAEEKASAKPRKTLIDGLEAFIAEYDSED